MDAPIDLTAGMPAHFTMPEEFTSVVEWAAAQGFTLDGRAYLRSHHFWGDGEVFFNDPQRVGWEGYLADPDRLWFVASTGGDGSCICLWLDDTGEQHVVHHGSGSGSVLWAIMPSALAVLRLFAVASTEMCWNGEWAAPPSDRAAAGLQPYRSWLRERWEVDVIPGTGLEALGIAPDGPDAAAWLGEGPPNAFADWLEGDGTLP